MTEKMTEANPYRAPSPILDTPPPRAALEPPSDEKISKTELIAFAGGERYPALMYGLLNGTTRHAGFNIWAALFGIQWYFFRKLYLFGLLSFVLEYAIPFGAFKIMRFLFGRPGIDFTIIALCVLLVATRIINGYMANIALCLKASAVIAEIDKLNKSNEAHLRLIADAGGVSVPSLLLIYVPIAVLRQFL
jgi:hypothetical protein